MRIDSKAVAPAITGTCSASVLSRTSSGRMPTSITPDLAIAALTTSAEAMITTTSLVKPLNALFTGTTPTAMPISSATSDTTS